MFLITAQFRPARNAVQIKVKAVEKRCAKSFRFYSQIKNQTIWHITYSIV